MKHAQEKMAKKKTTPAKKVAMNTPAKKKKPVQKTKTKPVQKKTKKPAAIKGLNKKPMKPKKKTEVALGGDKSPPKTSTAKLMAAADAASTKLEQIKIPKVGSHPKALGLEKQASRVVRQARREAKQELQRAVKKTDSQVVNAYNAFKQAKSKYAQM